MSEGVSMNTLKSYEEFADFIPHRISRRQALAMAADGRFPPFVRAYSRAEAYWREVDIIRWIVFRYKAVLPEYTARLEREGLCGAPFSHDESF